MPPIYHRVWTWLKLKVGWAHVSFPTKRPFRINLAPGQIICSIQDIADGVAWTEWGKERKLNKKTISDVLVWLEKEGMIWRESNGKGTFISIVNWSLYNPQSNAESNDLDTASELLPSPPAKPKKAPKAKREKAGEFDEITAEVGEMFLIQLPPAYKDRREEFLSALAEFTRRRVSKRVPWTPRSIARFCQRLQEFSGENLERAIAIIDKASSSGWTDIYQLKEDGQNGKFDKKGSAGGGPDRGPSETHRTLF
ncbi:MAG: hypothetical protein ONB55_21865 [candidate division KSB1 bacterium]|nr:hypothetical protein [candidate division KSB1 bacterium]